MAVDGTDVETWGALHGEATTVDLDGEAAETQLMDDGTVPKPKKPARKARSSASARDGRNHYTVDPDARAGHRSATNCRPAGPYVGYELHLAVQARDVKWTNCIDKISLSDEVPGVITCFSPQPRRHPSGRAIVDDLVAAKQAGEPIDDVVWDPGYSCASRAPRITSWPRPASIRPSSPSPTSAASARSPATPLLIDGQLYSQLLPDDLRDLPVPPRGASEAEKRDLRGQVQPAGPVADGPPRRPRRRRGHPVAVPVLRRVAPLPALPQDDAPAQDRAARPGRRGLREVLRRDPHRHAGRDGRGGSASPSAPPPGGSRWAAARSSSPSTPPSRARSPTSAAGSSGSWASPR